MNRSVFGGYCLFSKSAKGGICVSFLFATELEIESTRLWEEAEAHSKVGIKLKHNDY